MKPFLLLLSVLFIACASSSSLSFRPKGSTDSSWDIKATKGPGSILVLINGTTVIDESIGILARSGDYSGTYQNKKVNVHLIYDNGFLGIGSGWETTVYVDGEIAGRFKL